MARRFPTPWREEKFSGGYVVRDATGQALAYLYARSTESEAVEARQLTFDEARRIAVNIARLPEVAWPLAVRARQASDMSILIRRKRWRVCWQHSAKD